jgi:hypothetical protein
MQATPFAEGFSPTVATFDPVFPFLSVNRVKSAIAGAMAGENPLAKHWLSLNYCFFGVSHKNSTEILLSIF